MKKYYFALFLTIFFYQPLRADSLELKELLPFDKYPVNTIFKGTPSKNIDITTHPWAHQFRTMLREGAKKGVNFAGHYTIATWGCGTGCFEFGIIDVHTGKVFFPANLSRVTTYSAGDFQLNGWTETEEESFLNSKPFLTENDMFRKDSSLLIIYGLPESEEVKYIQDTQHEHEGKGLYYFSWENNELKLLGKLLLSSDKARILHLATNGNISDLGSLFSNVKHNPLKYHPACLK